MKKKPNAARKQSEPIIHHSEVKPNCCATCDPTTGPNTCAVAQAIVYKPAYCPRLEAPLLEIQNEFMNGIDKISPIVTTIIAQIASALPPGKRLYNTKEKLTSVTPIEIYDRFDLFPSSWYTRII